MKVIICGSRSMSDEDARRAGELLDTAAGIEMVIEGGAKGADNMAYWWARTRGIHCAKIEALWHVYGRAAGPLRNEAMLQLTPDAVIAFPGGCGTATMVKLAKSRGIRVIEIGSDMLWPCKEPPL